MAERSPRGAPPSAEDDPGSASYAALCEDIDDQLVLAVRKAGWPTWVTLGQGGSEPRRTEHIFTYHALDEGARIDFWRGMPSDDWSNFDWSALLDK